MVSIPAKHFLILMLMLLSAGLAAGFKPSISLADERGPTDLNAMLPTAFGEWQVHLLSSAHIVDPQTQEKLDKIYSETISRTYVNGQGYQIMLSIAYGKNQSDALQLHKPEVCYPAQGFEVVKKQADVLTTAARALPTTRLMTKLNQREEPVTYWTVVGDYVINGGIDKKLTEMRYSLDNKIPDGMLIRISSIDGDSARAYRLQDQFAQQMLAAINPVYRDRFSGSIRTENIGVRLK